MKYVIAFFLSFGCLYLFLYLFYFLRLKKKGMLSVNRASQFIIRKYELKKSKKMEEKLNFVLVGVNSFILAIPITLSYFLQIHYMGMLILSFVLFMLLFYSLYHIVGMLFKRKEDQNEINN